MRDELGIKERLVSESRDRVARKELARLRAIQGQLGQALREFSRLQRTGPLSANDLALHARLLRERAEERLRLSDADALLDYQRAKVASPGADVYALAAVASLRHSSQFERAKAPGFLQALPASDPRRYVLAPEELGESELAEVFQWLQAGNARREALKIGQRYVDEGGRDGALLQQWRDLHAWWHGDSRPALPSAAAELTRAPQNGLLVFFQSLEMPPDVSAATLSVDYQVPDWHDQLEAIRRAHRKDPALAERLARRFVDRPVYGARERAIIVELFFRLGDMKRARVFARDLAALSERMPVFDLVAGLATAAASDVDAAELLFTSAAAASGDPGAYWAIAARSYRGLGAYLPAIAASRKALSLTAGGHDAAILMDLAFSQRALGRERDALATEAVLLERVPAADRPRAEEIMALDRKRGRSKTLLGPVRAQLGF